MTKIHDNTISPSLDPNHRDQWSLLARCHVILAQVDTHVPQVSIRELRRTTASPRLLALFLRRRFWDDLFGGGGLETLYKQAKFRSTTKARGNET